MRKKLVRDDEVGEVAPLHRELGGRGRGLGGLLHFAIDCLLKSMACTRITWLFVRSLVRHHAENGQIHSKMVVDCPLVITSKVKPFSRTDKTRKEE